MTKEEMHKALQAMPCEDRTALFQKIDRLKASEAVRDMLDQNDVTGLILLGYLEAQHDAKTKRGM